MRELDRKIIHIDMDCFYAAVEMLDRPDLRDRPMAVGGRPEFRGVITTCNYKAREFGVRSALSVREALRRCPDLVILPTRFQKYREASQKIREIFARYTSHIEPLSLDEAYLDLTDNELFDGSATKTAQAIRHDIFKELGLTASAGIANSKFLAKIASDWKKPNGQFTITPQDIESFVLTLDVGKIPGVGKVTLVKMNKMGFKTCADLQKLSRDEMSSQFGRFGDRLYDLCRGIDHSSVKSERQRKSISVESTFSKDIADWTSIEKQTIELFEELRLRIGKSKIDESQLKSLSIKFKSHDFNLSTRERALPFSKESFVLLANEHFMENSEPIRLLGLGCKLQVTEEKKSRNQMSLF